jgi:hypothetical protein
VFASHFPRRRPASTPPWPISACEPGLPPITTPPTLIVGTHPSDPSSPKSPSSAPARVATLAELRRRVGPLSPPPHREDAHVCACHLESSHQLWCAVALHHRCPHAPALAVAAPVRFQSWPLSDKALTQHALLAELPLPKACHVGCRLALPARA